jgi:nitrate reductase (NAD(P)H)
MYNGKLLTPDHGFPVRLIIPGYIGGRMIKWITNIDLQPQESQDYYHFYDNRYYIIAEKKNFSSSKALVYSEHSIIVGVTLLLHDVPCI